MNNSDENQKFNSSNALNQRVDINILLAKVRNQKNKEKKENIIFVGLVCGVVAVTGVIASL
tara:strand:- start:235 stop:417 length:183 start_codon:yes stop_codon:yes gene_type:complete